MNNCGCGFPMTTYGCTSCSQADQRRRAGRCVDCGSPKRAVGVYCLGCFDSWAELRSSLSPPEAPAIEEGPG